VAFTATGPSGSTFKNWNFSDGTNTVNGSGTSNTWSGTMVTSGTVSVTVASNGQTANASASITVNKRSNFAFSAVNPAQLASNSITCYDNSLHSLPSPPVSGALEGYSCADLTYSFNFTTVSDNGPNSGYEYATSASDANLGQPTKFEYIVVSDLLSASSTFYIHQCGTYSSADTSGFIAGSQLRQNAFDHEQGSVLSHWTEYRDAQNNSGNNIGTVLETAVGAPGGADNSFAKTKGDAALNRIAQAVSAEPCGGLVNKDSSQSCKNLWSYQFLAISVVWDLPACPALSVRSDRNESHIFHALGLGARRKPDNDRRQRTRTR